MKQELKNLNIFHEYFTLQGLKYYSDTCLEGLRKATKNLVEKAGLWAEI